MSKTVWVAGATGLIGGHLIKRLAKHSQYDNVIALVRQPSGAEWASLPNVKEWIVDYKTLSEHKPIPEAENVHDVFCALGSTTKKTPDKKAYYEIDVTYPLEVAKLGLAHGAKFYGLVSAHGASANAFTYYMKMKGSLERQLRKLAYPHQAFARPSLLLGDRKEFRPAEKAGELFMGILPGNYKAIKAEDVAAALIEEANTAHTGNIILESQMMQGAAGR